MSSERKLTKEEYETWKTREENYKKRRRKRKKGRAGLRNTAEEAWNQGRSPGMSKFEDLIPAWQNALMNMVEEVRKLDGEQA